MNEGELELYCSDSHIQMKGVVIHVSSASWIL